MFSRTAQIFDLVLFCEVIITQFTCAVSTGAAQPHGAKAPNCVTMFSGTVQIFDLALFREVIIPQDASLGNGKTNI